jgi:hypothetical protein
MPSGNACGSARASATWREVVLKMARQSVAGSAFSVLGIPMVISETKWCPKRRASLPLGASTGADGVATHR